MTFGGFVTAGENGNGSNVNVNEGAPVSLAKKVDEVNEVKQVDSVSVNEGNDNEYSNKGKVVGTENEGCNEKLAVKVSFGNDVRRASFTPGSSFAALCELVTKLFGVDQTSVLLRYQDGDGDKITVSSDEELQEAIRLSKDMHKMVRLFVDKKSALNVEEQPPCIGHGMRRPFPPGPHGPFHGHHPGLFHGHPAPFPPPAQPTMTTPLSFFRGHLPPFPPHFHPSPAHPTHTMAAPPGIDGFFSPITPNGGGSCFPFDPAPQGPMVNYAIPIFAFGTFSPAPSDLSPPAPKKDAAARLRACQEREAFKARRHAMREVLRTMKANASTEEDKQAIKEYKAKVKAEFKNTWKGFKQQKRSKLDGIAAKFVADVSIADNSELPPNLPVLKTWRVKNSGTTVWPAGCQLVMSANHSDSLPHAPERVVLEGSVLPQEEVEVSTPFTTPTEPGRYVAYYRLAMPDGQKFGQRLWMAFIIPAPAPTTDAAKAAKLVDDTFPDATPTAPDADSGFVVLSNLALD